ncbi:MAG: hypothetical protein AABY28_02885 [Candidatus Omnitrophota bacterium]
MNLPNRIKSVTLLELLIAIVLVSFVIIAITSIEVFSRYHVLSSDRRVKLQNEASLALEHMTKHISQAIGNTVSDPMVKAYADGSGVRVRVDSNQNGMADAADTWIAYRIENIGTPVTDAEIRYYENAGNGEAPAGSYQSIARKVVIKQGSSSGLEFIGNFDPQRWLTDRPIEGKVVCRFRPAEAVSVDNPETTMRTKIDMPFVSTN